MILNTRMTSRHRPLARATGDGPHSAASGAMASTALAAPTIVAAPSRGERAVQRGLARCDLTQRRHRSGVHELGMGDAGVVAVGREHLRRT